MKGTPPKDVEDGTLGLSPYGTDSTFVAKEYEGVYSTDCYPFCQPA